MTQEQQQRIAEAIASQRQNYESDGSHAIAIGVSNTAYSFIKSGQLDRIAPKTWMRIAREIGVSMDGREWKPAKTHTYIYLTAQFEMCQKGHVNKAFCDLPDIGKSYTAAIYAKTHRNVAHVDCSVYRTRSRLIRRIARLLGIESEGSYYKVRDNMVNTLRTLDDPLVILDEAGDIAIDALRELKGIINETGTACAWYFMGADGFKVLYERAIRCEKLGFAEMFSRMGGAFDNITNNKNFCDRPQDLLRKQVAAVAAINFDAKERKEAEVRANGSLRALNNSFKKLTA